MKILSFYTCIFMFCLVLLSSCQKGDEPNKPVEDCGVDNPMEDLAWLSLQKDNCSATIDCRTYFYKAVHNFKMVFYNQLEGIRCTPSKVSLYNCAGKLVIEYSEADKSKFDIEVTDIQFLLACE